MSFKTKIIKGEFEKIKHDPTVKEALQHSMAKASEIDDGGLNAKEFLQQNPELIDNISKDVAKIMGGEEQEIDLSSSEIHKKLEDLSAEDIQELGEFVLEILKS